MLSLRPSREDRDARHQLGLLITPPHAPDLSCSSIRRLHERFLVMATTCPSPLPAPGLIVTPEMRAQSELYLPVSEVTAAFHHLYRTSLCYPPILESTPFHTAMSWSDAFSCLPGRFQTSANPARLLEQLIDNRQLLIEFLCASFLPNRFYGGFSRYPRQREYIRSWLHGRMQRPLRCLDAACGTGEESYALALLLLEMGFRPADFRIEGWTIEPLEVWAAATACFPHDRDREWAYRRETEDVFRHAAAQRIRFQVMDLRERTYRLSAVEDGGLFDLILCNGLLGGPILHRVCEVQNVIAGLKGLLAPGGLLLAADNFHGGWKQKYPQEWLRVQCAALGLDVWPAGEGIAALRQVNTVNALPDEVGGLYVRQ